MELREALEISRTRGLHWLDPSTQNLTKDDLVKLGPQDPESKLLLNNLAHQFEGEYAKAVQQVHGRLPQFDGELGPAMEVLLAQRETWCPVPDVKPPPGVDFHFEDPDLQQVAERMQREWDEAVGKGNWPRCHGVGEFHSAVCEWNTSGLPSFLNPVFIQCLQHVQAAYCEVGLLWHFVQNGKNMLPGQSYVGRANTNASFVSRSSGWIGLATVATGQGCNASPMFNKYLATYRPSDVLRYWFVLLMHELGHNTGTGHINGTIMHPSIGLSGSTNDYKISNDSFRRWLNDRYGGQKVPIPGGDPDPPDDPDPPSDIEKRLLRVETELDIHWSYLAELNRRLTKLEG